MAGKEQQKNKKRKIIAVDLGGTNLRIGFVYNGKVLKYIKKNTSKNKKELLKELYSGIEELMTKDVIGIGMGSPGPLKDGIIKNPPNLPLRNFNIKKELMKRFRKKVVIENDAKCVAIAEAEFGCRKKNFIVITLGTGIGGGIIINRSLYKGQGYAGEIGGIILDNGKSSEKLWQESREMIKRDFGKDILIKDLIKMKDENSEIILNRIVHYLGQHIGSLINIFDPEAVILMGGIRESGKFFLDRIKKEARKYSTLPKETPISWSKLEHPGILGASLLIK